MLKSYLLTGLFLWICFAFFWIYPIKLKLQKKHGFDKDNNYFLELAKHNDPLACLARKRTKIFLTVGIIGGVILAFLK